MQPSRELSVVTILLLSAQGAPPFPHATLAKSFCNQSDRLALLPSVNTDFSPGCRLVGETFVLYFLCMYVQHHNKIGTSTAPSLSSAFHLRQPCFLETSPLLQPRPQRRSFPLPWTETLSSLSTKSRGKPWSVCNLALAFLDHLRVAWKGRLSNPDSNFQPD